VLTPDTSTLTDEEREAQKTSSTAIKFLPLLIGYFSLQGLTFYWAASNVFTLGQSIAVKVYFKSNPLAVDIPKYWQDMLNDAETADPSKTAELAKVGLAKGASLEELLDNARSHVLVKRMATREASSAWERVKTGGQAEAVSKELQGWVNE